MLLTIKIFYIESHIIHKYYSKFYKHLNNSAGPKKRNE